MWTASGSVQARTMRLATANAAASAVWRGQAHERKARSAPLTGPVGPGCRFSLHPPFVESCAVWNKSAIYLILFTFSELSSAGHVNCISDACQAAVPNLLTEQAD